MKIIATPSTGSGQTGIEDPPLIVRILVVWVCPPSPRRAHWSGDSIYSKWLESRNRLPTQADDGARYESERAPDGEQNKRFRPLHRPNRPKQDPHFS
jgi:hypothetical protein